LASIFGNDVALMVDNCLAIDESRRRPAIASQQTGYPAKRRDLTRLIAKDHIAIWTNECERLMVIREKHGVGNIFQDDAMHTFGVAKRPRLPLALFERSSQCAHFNFELLANRWIIYSANEDIFAFMGGLSCRFISA
jgi:hypothetical protein